jgi:RNA polymerase sigma-70 factor (ECF subfamily)
MVDQNNVDEKIIEIENEHLLKKNLTGLSPRERELLAFKYGAELNNRQIAQLTGLTESNVGVIMFRTIEKLRTLWKEGQNER